MNIAKKVLLPLGLIVIAVFAARLALEKDSTDYSSNTFGALVKAVDSDFDANEARADSAPQQQVVAGWATKDYLSVVARQAEETNIRVTEAREAAQRNSERLAKLIGLGIAAICWIGIWMPFGGPKRSGSAALGMPSVQPTPTPLLPAPSQEETTTATPL